VIKFPGGKQKRTLRSIKSALVLALAFFFVFPIAARQSKAAGTTTWSGYLIDLICARERKQEEIDLGEKHTKKCMQMPICDRAGYGLLTDSNELLVFDQEGNRKVRLLLQQINQESHLHAVVAGTKSNDVVKVSKIKLQK
jgi:hypothetical protein